MGKISTPAALFTAILGGARHVEITGDWPLLDLNGVEGVTLSGDATVRAMTVRNSADVALVGLRLDYIWTDPARPTHYAWKADPFLIVNSVGVAVTDCDVIGDAGGPGVTVKAGKGIFDISGAPMGTGLMVRDSAHVAIRGGTVDGFRTNVGASNCDHFDLSGVVLSGCGNDNLRLVEVRDVMVAGNDFGDITDHENEPFHNDHIHHFNVHAEVQSARVTIRANTFFSRPDNRRSGASGMMLQNSMDTPLERWTICDNLLVGRAHHGITLWPAADSVIARNTIIDNGTEPKTDPGLVMRSSGGLDPVRGRIVGNVLAKPVLGRKVTPGVERFGDVTVEAEDNAAAYIMPDPANPRTYRARPDGPAWGHGAAMLWQH